jgi:hypothetical protein
MWIKTAAAYPWIPTSSLILVRFVLIRYGWRVAMHPLTHFAIPLDSVGPWLAMVGFGAYHGLNPGMGWLFALALGLQQRSERAIWMSLFPITVGHAASIALMAALVLAVGHLLSVTPLRLLTAAILSAFGIYKLFTYYRHPRWVGMRVNMRDLFAWSFLMAAAHGAGLMVAPALLGVIDHTTSHGAHLSTGVGLGVAVGLHTAAMLAVMALVAWIVYKKLGLMVLRKNWINFDLIWAGALLIVGGIALVRAI